MQVTTTDAGWKVKLTKRERKQLDNAADVITLLTELPCGFKAEADFVLRRLLGLLAALDEKEKPHADTSIPAKAKTD